MIPKKYYTIGLPLVCAGIAAGSLLLIFFFSYEQLLFYMAALLILAIAVFFSFVHIITAESRRFGIGHGIILFAVGVLLPLSFILLETKIKQYDHGRRVRETVEKLEHYKDSAGSYPMSKYDILDSATAEDLRYTVDSAGRSYCLH